MFMLSTLRNVRCDHRARGTPMHFSKLRQCRNLRDMFIILRWIQGSSHKRTLMKLQWPSVSHASSKLSEVVKSGVNAKSWVRIIYGNIKMLSEFNKSQGAYYTWGRIINGNLR